MAKTKKQEVKRIDNRTYLNDKSSDYINRTSREYSLYTLERHLVGIDGLKSAQRKAIYGLSKVQGKIKTMSLSGKIIEMEIYVHGDSSASKTISQMASPVSNNYPLIEGIGSFGSCSSPEPAAARYTYVKKSKLTENLILRDSDIIPMKDNYDGSTKEPRHYLPLIPLAFMGTSGMSVGYRPNILPRNIYDIIENTIRGIDGEEMKFMTPYYKSYGARDYAEHLGGNKFIVYGKAEIIDGSTVRVTGLPPNISREKFVEKLIDMQDKNEIRDYDDASTKNIDITIKLPRGLSATWVEDDILKFFKLNNKLSEAVIVLTEEDTVKVYDEPNDLIKDFIKVRFSYYVKRYEKLLQDAMQDLRYKLLIKECFDNDIPAKIKGFKNRAEMQTAVKDLNKVIEATDSNIDSIVSFASYRWTEEYFNNLVQDINSLVQDIGKYEAMLKDQDQIWAIYRSELVELQKLQFDV